MDGVVAGITAAPRAESYLERTLPTILPQTGEIRIFAEPGTRIPDQPGVRVDRREVRHGNFRNWREAGRQLVQAGASCVLMLEDDVLLAPGAVQAGHGYLSRHPRVGIVSLYTSGFYRMRPRAGRSLFWPPPRRIFIGACAVMFRRSALRRLVEHQLADRWQGTRPQAAAENPAMIDGVDLYIGKAAQALRLQWVLAKPSLAQHIGEHSAVGNDRGLTPRRRAPDFRDQ